jgi:hypothetical protein
MFHQFIQNNERILWVVDQILGQFFDYHTHGFGCPLRASVVGLHHEWLGQTGVCEPCGVQDCSRE